MIKAQISMELMVVIGIILAMFIPIIYILYSNAQGVQERLMVYEGEALSERIATVMNMVGKSGDGSFVIIDITIPKNFKKMEIRNSEKGEGSEVIITMDYQGKEYDAVYPSEFKVKKEEEEIKLNSGGNYRIKVENDGGIIGIKIGVDEE